MSYLKDREIWLPKTPTGNPPAGYYWKFIQDGVVVVRDSDGVDRVPVDKSGDTMTGLLRATAGINFLASGGDTFQNYEIGVWNPSSFTGSQIGCSSTSFDSNLQYVRIGDMMFVQIKGTTTISGAGIACSIGVESLPEPMYDNNAFPFGSILIDLVNASPDIWTFSNNTQFGWTWLSRTAVTTGFHGWACYRVAP